MSNIAGQLLVQVVLILLNAFFAATEIAVISLNENKVKARANSGDKKAHKMMKMIEEPTAFLSTIQIGITLAGFLGSAFAADNFANGLSAFIIKSFEVSDSMANAIKTMSVIVITLILSFFTLVFGELVPKRVAMKYKEKLADIVCGFITVLSKILRPIIWLLTVTTNGVLRLLRINPHEKDEPVSEEDIVIMLDAGADEGTIKTDDLDYIKNIFKLDNLSAKDIMTPNKNITSVTDNMSKDEILEIIASEGYSRIPVFKEDEEEIIGILNTKNYLLQCNRDDFVLNDVTSEPVFVPETIHLDVLLKQMKNDCCHMVIPVNEYGYSVGILTMEDIIEELLGEIWDEKDDKEEVCPE